MTTREFAKELKITSRKLRRILRSINRFADGVYTRYKLNKRDMTQIRKALES